MSNLTAPPSPPRAEDPSAEAVRHVPVHVPLRRKAAGGGPRRLSAGALAGSFALHAGLVALAVAFVRFGPGFIADRTPAAEEPTERVTFYDVAPAPVPAAPGEEALVEPEAPASAPRPADARRSPGPAGAAQPELSFPGGVPSGLPAAGGEAPAAGGAGGTGTGPGGGWVGGGPLRPGMRDPRLYAPDHPAVPERELTEHEEYMGRLGTTLGEYNDSIAAEGKRNADALDWTVKGKNGERYGFSPGKIHLGKLTLPNPLGVGPNPAERERTARIAAHRQEIDRQVGDTDRRNSFRERVRATRERRDAERARARAGS